MKHLNRRAVPAVALAAALAGCSGGGSSPPLSGISNATQSSSTAPQSSSRAAVAAQPALAGHPGDVKRVLLISVDGMHAVDLQRFVASNPSSTLAMLSKSGTTYTEAHTPVPSDSFPGLLALVTGGHPASTGVYYENNFDRSGYPPGSNCAGPVGTIVHLDESIDFNANDIHGGGGIDPTKLTLQKTGGSCTPVFPHQYLRVNTAFEVVKAHGGRTAWSDKEQSYEMLNGPSGHGVDDLYNLEIAAGGTTGSEVATQAYDNLKVTVILNQIDGKSSTGAAGAGVPTLFGMNFQAVSVGQKLATDPATGLHGGYVDASGTPGPMLAGALTFVDTALGKFVSELKAKGLYDTTAIVVTAKHGNQPIDHTLRRGVDPTGLSTALAGNLGNGFIQTDDLALIWLQNRSDANEDSALANLKAVAVPEAFDQGVVFTRTNQPPGWGRWSDPRMPDFGIEPNAGVIYTTGTKVSEHGGFRDDDTHVALLVSRPGAPAVTVTRAVQTTQVAPTILHLLDIAPGSLQAVGQEGTSPLPRLGGD
ncbi:MAG TPA: alkaline phosphatase family protein [Candidatus Elarobacter sp.]|nr:alkaline phosphatase family protein [Candidatus Elarobacter sp.]